MPLMDCLYTANGHNLQFPYAPSPSGGGLGWGLKSQDYDRWQYKNRSQSDFSPLDHESNKKLVDNRLEIMEN